MPLNTVGNKRISLVRDADATIVTSSSPSVVVGVRADQHAAAVALGVAERGQREVRDEFARRRTTTGTAAAAAWRARRPSRRCSASGRAASASGWSRSVTSESKPAAITVPNHLSVPSAPSMRPRSTVSTSPSTTTSAAASGSLCGNAEFAGVVVAGARRDDAERNVGLREHLQRKRDDAVTADDDERVHAAFEGAVDEPPRVLGVGARDRDDVDAALLQLGDRPFGRVRRTAVPRRRIGQHRDAADPARSVTESACPG